MGDRRAIHEHAALGAISRGRAEEDKRSNPDEREITRSGFVDVVGLCRLERTPVSGLYQAVEQSENPACNESWAAELCQPDPALILDQP